MDFHSLSRRELQSLSKKNKIPANMTNVAMADALAALPEVEGIEEFLNLGDSQVRESPKKEDIIPSEVPRTALRTSARRKAVKEDPRSSQPMTRTRRGTASRCGDEPDRENKDLNAGLTPALLSGRRRTAAASACKKVDFQTTVNVGNEINLDEEKNEIPETPVPNNCLKRVAASSARRKTETRNNGTTEKRVYSTRRSMRLLEKNMEDLSLMQECKAEPINVQLSFEEMTESTGSGKETDVEIESKIVKDLESKSDAVNASPDEIQMDSEVEDQEKNVTKSDVEISEAKPETDLDESTCSAVKLSNQMSSNDETANSYETDVARDSLDERNISNYETEKEDASKENGTEFPLLPENVTEVDNLSTLEKSCMSVEKSCSAVKLCSQTSSNDETSNSFETDVPSDSLDERNISNDETAEEDASKEYSPEVSLPLENVNVTEVDLSTLEKSCKSMEEVQTEYSCESDCTTEADFDHEDLEMNNSAQLSLTQDNKEEETEVQVSEESVMNADGEAEYTEGDENDLLMVPDEANDSANLPIPLENEKEGSITGVEDGQNNMTVYESKSGESYNNVKEKAIEEKKDCKMVSDQAEEVPMKLVEDINSCDNGNLPSSLIEELVEVEVQFLVNEGPKQLNETLITLPKMPANAEAVCGMGPFAADQLAGQFPRPTVISPAKEETTKLLLDASDSEEEDVQEHVIEKTDLSLRQLRKLFKDQLQLSKKKKMDDNKNVGKVRTALQPLAENRMENRFLNQ